MLESNRALARLAICLAVVAGLSCGGSGGGGGVQTDDTYTITLVNLTPSAISDEQWSAFTGAAARIEGFVTKGLTVGHVSWSADALAACGVTRSQVDFDTIHGLVILVSVKSLGDGVIAQSGPCLVRGGSKLPMVSVLEFDSCYLNGGCPAHPDALGASDRGKTILHEMLHTLGFGTMWPASEPGAPGFNLLSGHYFTGTHALAAAKAQNGAPPAWPNVPVEDCLDVPSPCGLTGTKDSHWRYSAFAPATGHELMVGWIDEGNSQPLSATTIASLSDLGYTVDTGKADAFAIPTPGAALRASAPGAGAIFMGDDVRRVPPVVVEEGQ